MRSKKQFVIMRFNDDTSFQYLNVNGKWSNSCKLGFSASNTRFWNNAGNAWNAIAKLVKNRKARLSQLFVMNQENELIKPSFDHGLSMANILGYVSPKYLEEIIDNIDALEEMRKHHTQGSLQ
jgi:hypothetical protein